MDLALNNGTSSGSCHVIYLSFKGMAKTEVFIEVIYVVPRMQETTD